MLGVCVTATEFTPNANDARDLYRVMRRIVDQWSSDPMQWAQCDPHDAKKAREIVERIEADQRARNAPPPGSFAHSQLV